MRTCTACGKTKKASDFYKAKKRKQPLAECKQCFKDRMAHRHQEHKDALVAELGGCCEKCGYNKCAHIMQFHHIDPSTKEFGLSKRLSASLDVLKKEAAKCILLCPTCHAEKHQGLW